PPCAGRARVFPDTSPLRSATSPIRISPRRRSGCGRSHAIPGSPCRLTRHPSAWRSKGDGSRVDPARSSQSARFMAIAWAEYLLHTQLSPRNHLAVPHEFPGKSLRRIKSEPYGGIGTLGNIAIGISAAHICLDPPRAGSVYGDPVPKLGREDRSHSIQSCFRDAIGGVVAFHLRQCAHATGYIYDTSGLATLKQRHQAL